MVPDPVVLGPEVALEEALLRACSAKAEILLVTDKQRQLLGVASLHDLTLALERWYDHQRIVDMGPASSASASASASASVGGASAGAAAGGRGLGSSSTQQHAQHVHDQLSQVRRWSTWGRGYRELRAIAGGTPSSRSMALDYTSSPTSRS